MERHEFLSKAIQLANEQIASTACVTDSEWIDVKTNVNEEEISWKDAIQIHAREILEYATFGLDD